MRHALSALAPTPIAPPVSTAIACIQVGATCLPTASGPPFSLRKDCTVPSTSRITARRVHALIGDDLARLERLLNGDLCPLLELSVVEVVEQVDRPDVRDGDHASTRYWWISETAIEPSPTALATRLIERARTSPATNTPGTVVSSR